MSHSGLQAVSNASEMFLSEQDLDSDVLAGLAVAVIMDGSRTFLIEIQVIFLLYFCCSSVFENVKPSMGFLLYWKVLLRETSLATITLVIDTILY